MKKMHIYFLSILISSGQTIFGQCVLPITTSFTNSSCSGCNNGMASVSVTGGTAPYTYVWSNSISTTTAIIAPSKDNSIFEESISNSNGSGQNFVAGETNAGFKTRALIAFDIAGNIPTGATINSVSLKINMLFTSGTSGPQPQYIHKLLENWGEGTSISTQPGQGTAAASNDATWVKAFYPSVNWTTPGGTFVPTASASTIVNQQAIYTWSSAAMAVDVQGWLNIPATNFGWLLKGAESGYKQAKRFGSRENVVPGYAPVLNVTYGPSVIGNTNSLSNLAPGTYNVTVTDVNGCTASATVTVGIGINATAITPEPTTYRGAFAPAPVAQWTNNWTNWDPQNTSYGVGLPIANKSGVIGSASQTSITWVKDSVYLLQGLVFVDSLVTLTIEPGTIIKGDANLFASSLVIQRGAKIMANGTICNPIVFTSSKAPGSRVRGDWGGVAILGRGFTNLGTNVPLDGIGISNVRGRFGGTDDTDNSGSLKYVRIEYAGYTIAEDNQLGLTFGAVGSGTTVDYVQTSFGNDDAFQWYGGAVNCKHLVAYRTLDDDFDTDNGYSGTVQFGLAIKDPAVSE